MWVVVAVLVIAVIAVIIATSLDRGTSINYTQFREYANNYTYAVKNADGELQNRQTVKLSFRYPDDSEEDGYRDDTLPAGEVITRITIDQYSITAYAANGAIYTLSARSFLQRRYYRYRQVGRCGYSY